MHFQELPTVVLQPPALLHTDNLGETDMEEEEGDKREGEEGVTAWLSHCAVRPTLSTAASPQSEQLSISTHVPSVFCTHRHTRTHTPTNCKFSNHQDTERREELRWQKGVNQSCGSVHGWNEV